VATGVNVAAKRQLILREQEGATGPLEAELNNTKYSGIEESTMTTLTPTPVPGSVGLGGNFATETPRVGSTEVWEIADLTPDAHPIHVHLIQFQVLSRQPINGGVDDLGNPFGYFADWLALLPNGDATGADGPPRLYTARNADGAVGGNPAFGPYLTVGPRRAADANEQGWKDTVVVLPGEVTRLAIRWAPTTTAVSGVAAGTNLFPFDPSLTDRSARDFAGNPGASGYLWHCHILEHEDNEMMRPYAVAR
jgi:FtsP/CotA-like multicopper oxidase with cupredoxin domain